MVISLVLSLTLGLAAMAGAAGEKPKVMITTGGIGGVYYYYGTSVAEILTKNADIEATAIQTAASVDNLLLVQRRTDPRKNTYYFGTVLPDSAYLAYLGQSERFKDKPAKEVRILWAMYPNLLHVVAAPGSGIKSMADFKGKRVSTGAPGSGTEVEAFLVMEGAGIKTSDLGKHERLGAAESSESLSHGTLDAYIWSGGLPTASITELATSLARKGSKMVLVDLPPASELVKTLLARFPGVMEPGVIGKDVYGTDADNQTLAFWNFMVCHQDVPEEYAYKITKAMFEHQAQLQEGVKAAKDTTVANSVRFVNGTIPFHPGALRYFKEVGAIK
jgi:TRAP transporter TAXI family solute receptor